MNPLEKLILAVCIPPFQKIQKINSFKRGHFLYTQYWYSTTLLFNAEKSFFLVLSFVFWSEHCLSLLVRPVLLSFASSKLSIKWEIKKTHRQYGWSIGCMLFSLDLIWVSTYHLQYQAGINKLIVIWFYFSVYQSTILECQSKDSKMLDWRSKPSQSCYLFGAIHAS